MYTIDRRLHCDKDLSDIVLLDIVSVARLLRKLPKRSAIRRLIFLDALSSMMVKASEIAFRRTIKLFDSLARESDDHTLVMPFELWREVLLNDADLELARSSYARLSPEPYQPWIDKLDLKQFYSLPI